MRLTECVGVCTLCTHGCSTKTQITAMVTAIANAIQPQTRTWRASRV